MTVWMFVHRVHTHTQQMFSQIGDIFPHRRKRKLVVKFVNSVKGQRSEAPAAHVEADSGHFAVAIVTEGLSGRLDPAVITRDTGSV